MLKRVVIVLLAAAALFLTYRGLEFIGGGIYRRQMMAEVSKAKAQGLPVTWDDLFKEDATDSENSYAELSRISRKISAPPYDAYFKDMSDFTVNRAEEMTPMEWEAYRKPVDGLKDILPMISVAESYPQYTPPVELYKNGQISYTEVFRLTQLTAANAVLEARDGRMDEAADSLVLGFGIAGNLSDEPLPHAFRLMSSCLKMDCYALHQVELRPGLKEEHLKRLFDLLGKLDLNRSFERALQGEVVRIANLENGTPTAIDSTGKPLAKANDLYKAKSISDLREVIPIWLMPYREQVSKKLFPVKQLDFRDSAVSSMTTSPIHRDMTIALIDGERIALAVRAYEERFGAYPENLQDVSAKLGWQLPKDVFSGKDFGYRRHNGTLILYSIGADLKDDKGIPLPSGHSEGGDIAWYL